MVPLRTDPKLVKLLRDSAIKFAAMSPAEQEEMLRQQREGYVKAELSWPADCPYR